ncbi:MAG TPA: hypothetical protein VGE41_01830 [Verrucomicrobiae bacterium]|jgi:tetratricopeptide (TPR) repeat protein
MKAVLSFATRSLYLGIITACACYLGFRGFRHTDWYKDHLYHQLLTSDPQKQLHAATALVQLGAQDQLLEALKASNPGARVVARKAIEFLWFNAAGDEAYRLTEKAYKAAEEKKYDEALTILNELIRTHPNFAEAYNRRASVYWEMEEYDKSIIDSEKALQLNPYHYGALQGEGVCRLKLGDVGEACRRLRAALKIIPYDQTTRNSLKECEQMLRVFPPPRHAPDRSTDWL